MSVLNAKYVHTNLIASDWQNLVRFYQTVFDCIPVPPQRDLTGEAMESGTGIKQVHVQGMHLRLPGCGEKGPTLEIFNYNQSEPRQKTAVNRPGFGHIAFSVSDVRQAQKEVLAEGGGKIGEVVTVQIGPNAKVTWCYVTDPEGNVIELQSWN
jgi:predicted enzyme related to lactoylglutathione lyase